MVTPTGQSGIVPEESGLPTKKIPPHSADEKIEKIAKETILEEKPQDPPEGKHTIKPVSQESKLQSPTTKVEEAAAEAPGLLESEKNPGTMHGSLTPLETLPSHAPIDEVSQKNLAPEDEREADQNLEDAGVPWFDDSLAIDLQSLEMPSQKAGEENLSEKNIIGCLDSSLAMSLENLNEDSPSAIENQQQVKDYTQKSEDLSQLIGQLPDFSLSENIFSRLEKILGAKTLLEMARKTTLSESNQVQSSSVNTQESQDVSQLIEQLPDFSSTVDLLSGFNKTLAPLSPFARIVTCDEFCDQLEETISDNPDETKRLAEEIESIKKQSFCYGNNVIIELDGQVWVQADTEEEERAILAQMVNDPNCPPKAKQSVREAIVAGKVHRISRDEVKRQREEGRRAAQAFIGKLSLYLRTMAQKRMEDKKKETKEEKDKYTHPQQRPPKEHSLRLKTPPRNDTISLDDELEQRQKKEAIKRARELEESNREKKIRQSKKQDQKSTATQTEKVEKGREIANEEEQNMEEKEDI